MPKKPTPSAKPSSRTRAKPDGSLVIALYRGQDRLVIRGSAGNTKVETSIQDAARALLEPSKAERVKAKVLHFGLYPAQNKVGVRLKDGEALGETLATMAIHTAAESILAAAAAAKV